WPPPPGTRGTIQYQTSAPSSATRQPTHPYQAQPSTENQKPTTEKPKPNISWCHRRRQVREGAVVGEGEADVLGVAAAQAAHGMGVAEDADGLILEEDLTDAGLMLLLLHRTTGRWRSTSSARSR
ncbi:hypothetical protein, partial [Streptomyces sp. DH24]|uniref:hypothetical protein n=1 Tax=Streptomyces sp. DH24 TaxID=3040123 RepID=UPI002442D238